MTACGMLARPYLNCTLAVLHAASAAIQYSCANEGYPPLSCHSQACISAYLQTGWPEVSTTPQAVLQCITHVDCIALAVYVKHVMTSHFLASPGHCLVCAAALWCAISGMQPP